MIIVKILYRPFAIFAGLIGVAIGRRVFKQIWAQIDGEHVPTANTPDVPVGKVVSARALEAATMAAVGAAVDRATLNSFEYLTGIWAGHDRDEEKEKS